MSDVVYKFVNHYSHCGQHWSDSWDSMCNDRCPVCNAEIEPYKSDDIPADDNLQQ